MTDAAGRGYAPDDALWHADDGFDRAERPFEYQYFHAQGDAQLELPVGEAEIEVIRGTEARPVRRRVKIESGATTELEVVLERIADLASEGWWSGDIHAHMNYAGVYRMNPERLAFQASAEDLHLVENLIVNKEQRVPDIGYFDGSPDFFPEEKVIINHGQEFHTSAWGHLGLLGLRDHILLPGYAAYANTAAASLYPPNRADSGPRTRPGRGCRLCPPVRQRAGPLRCRTTTHPRNPRGRGARQGRLLRGGGF